MNNVLVTPAQGTSTLYWTQNNGLVAGDLYVFQVTATNGRGESQPSASISVYAATVPGVPLNLVRSSSTTQFAVTFTWSAPASNGGSPITDYAVYWD